MVPSYNWDDFVKACKAGVSSVQVMGKAELGARNDFKLTTKADTLKFIGDSGLSGMQFDKTKEWEKNPTPLVPVMVDSYDFFAGSDYGYIAFMHQPKTNMWLLKSFKKNTKTDPRKGGSAMATALQSALDEFKKGLK